MNVLVPECRPVEGKKDTIIDVHDAFGADDRDQPEVRADLLHAGEHRNGSDARSMAPYNVLHDGVLVMRTLLSLARNIS